MNIFINPRDRRPRAGWRIFNQLILFILLAGVLMLIKGALFPEISYKLVEALLMGTAGTASVWLAARMMDRRSFISYGLVPDQIFCKELSIGLALGGVAMTFIFLVEWALGWISVTGFGWERHSNTSYTIWFLGYLAAMLIIGFYEELIFRGYQILNMVEGLHAPSVGIKTAAAIAVGISSVIFGLLHAANPNASLISTFNIILAGVMLAVPYLLTGNLAMPIGIHISWNFFQGGIFGFAVSGTPFRGSLIQIDQTGNAFFTGGNFGPEAGVMGIMGMALILLASLWYIRQYNDSFSVESKFNQQHAKSVKQDE
jgi:membrane protease YdiL (CAAX protease family)